MTVEIDPIPASVIQRRLKSITEEMGLTLLRTTRSPILNEARDFVTGLYDADGEMLEQTEYIPVLAFALQPVCKTIIAYFGDDIHPGDVMLHNDVFSGGNQNNDVAAFRPVFHEETLIGWAACKGHQADIGGAVAGGYNPEAREVWQEAFRIPPVKIFDRGRLREDVWRMIFANIRYASVEEDIKAEIGGTRVGERGLLELVERHGLATFMSHKNYLFDRTEQMVASEISAIPDGRYTGESVVFYDGIRDGSVVVRVDEHRDVRVILGRRAQHRGPTDVDVFDCVGKAAPRRRDRGFERVQVYDDEVDRRDAVRVHDRVIDAAASQDAAMDKRM